MADTDHGDLRPFDYELPQAPKSIVDTWVTRLQAVAIVTALLASVEVSFVGTLQPPSGNDPASDVALRFFGYAGMILNLGATLSAVLLLLAVTQVPTSARRMYMTCRHGFPRKVFMHLNKKDDPAPTVNEKDTSISAFKQKLRTRTSTTLTPNTEEDIRALNHFLLKGDTEGSLLYAFGVARGWGWMLRHCIFCFLAGCICAFVHVGISLWLNQSRLVAAILMPIVFLGFFPPMLIFLFGMDSPGCDHCAAERKVMADLNTVFVDEK